MAETVTVGCKLPHGIIAELNGVKVELKGLNQSNIINGHGITTGVDKAFFDAWMEAKKELAFIKKGFVFAHTKIANVEAEAKEKIAEVTGFERLDPNKAPEGIEPLPKAAA